MGGDAGSVGFESVWATGAEFLSHFERTGETARFKHPAGAAGTEWAVPGSIASTVIRFTDRDCAFHVHAKVIENTDTAVLFEFLEEERDRLELVLAAAEGDSVPYFRRRHERFPGDLPVRLRLGTLKRQKMRALNISEGGVYIAGDPSLELQNPVRLDITFPTGRIQLRGHVTGTVGTGPKPGMSVEFAFESAEQRKQLGGHLVALRGS